MLGRSPGCLPRRKCDKAALRFALLAPEARDRFRVQAPQRSRQPCPETERYPGSVGRGRFAHGPHRSYRACWIDFERKKSRESTAHASKARSPQAGSHSARSRRGSSGRVSLACRRLMRRAHLPGAQPGAPAGSTPLRAPAASTHTARCGRTAVGRGGTRGLRAARVRRPRSDTSPRRGRSPRCSER